jgi:hypothetical protein
VAPRRLRQTRLDVGEPEAALAQRYANYRVLRRSFISATALASFARCSVKPFLERVLTALGLDSQTWAMREGLRAHEAVQGALVEAAPPSELTLAQALRSGAFAFGVEVPFRDERRMLRGIADVVVVRDGQAHVVELKNARPPGAADPVWGADVWYEHGIQLHFYGLLAKRELGLVPHLHLAYLRDGSKDAVLSGLAQNGDAEAAVGALVERAVRLPTTPQAAVVVNTMIRHLRRAEKRALLPVPEHADPQRCMRCPVRTWCPRRLDRPGEWEPLPADRLEEAL